MKDTIVEEVTHCLSIDERTYGDWTKLGIMVGWTNEADTVVRHMSSAKKEHVLSRRKLQSQLDRLSLAFVMQCFFNRRHWLHASLRLLGRYKTWGT